MPLATLAAVKAKLGDPGEAEDAAIQAVLDGAEASLLDLTRYDLTPTTRTEYFRAPATQLGRPIQLGYRPVGSITSVEARGLAAAEAASWLTYDYDLIDAASGTIVLLGGGQVVTWPPLATPWPSRRWRDYAPEVVKVVYVTAVPTDIDDLADACAALAAHWYRGDRRGEHAREVRAGPIGESYRNADRGVPLSILTRIGRHLRPVAGWV